MSQEGQAVSQYDLDKPRIAVYKKKNVESSPKYSILVQSEAHSKNKDCSSTKSLFSRHYLRFVLRKWYT